MRVFAKVFFALAAVSLALSYTDAGGRFLGGALKPLAAILFIVAYILQLLKGEVRQYDEDRERTLKQAQKPQPAPRPIADRQPAQHHCRSERLRPGQRFAQRHLGRRRRHHRMHNAVER
jgi:hypothetical protein